MRRSSFIFKENHVLIEEEENPSDKVVKVEEEPDSIDIDGIANLVDLPRLIFIDEKCGNLKVVVKNFVEIITEEFRSFTISIDVNSVTNAIDEIEVSIFFLAVTFFRGRL